MNLDVKKLFSGKLILDKIQNNNCMQFYPFELTQSIIFFKKIQFTMHWNILN